MKVALKKWFLYSLLTSWAFFAVTTVSLLYGSQLLSPRSHGKWILSYVLTPNEKTSDLFADSLSNKKASAHFDELIVFLDKKSVTDIERFKNKGFHVTLQNRTSVEKELIGLKTPYLVITSPLGEGVFAGQVESSDEAIRIAQSLYARKNLSSFPTLGCGSSMRAQEYFNPRALIEKAQ